MDLFDLEPDEIEVLFYRCRNQTPVQIQVDLGISSGEFFSRQNAAFTKLEIPGQPKQKFDNFRRKGLCEIVRQLTKEDIQNWYERREELRKKLTFPTPITSDANKETPRELGRGVENNRQKVWIAVAGLLFLVLAVGAFLLERCTIPPPPTPTPTPSATQETPVTGTFTAALTDTPTATLTNTPSPTPTPTSPTSTPTSIPTETLSPNTFFDDFADGLDPAWTKEFGNPVVSKEQLTAGELTLLSVGDPTWTDYQIEFDVAHISRHIAPGNNNNAIGVRATDKDNMIAFVFVVFDSSWYYLVDGKWSPVPGAIDCCVDDPAHVTIRVEGNKFTADNRKDFRVSFIDNDHPSGNIFLWIFPDSIYDNFKVTLLNP